MKKRKPCPFKVGQVVKVDTVASAIRYQWVQRIMPSPYSSGWTLVLSNSGMIHRSFVRRLTAKEKGE